MNKNGFNFKQNLALFLKKKSKKNYKIILGKYVFRSRIYSYFLQNFYLCHLKYISLRYILIEPMN